jgi:hypothetical protein
MRSATLTLGLAAAVVAMAAGPLAGQAPTARRLDIAFDQQGRVTLVAANVTVREVLAEWARVGGSRIVNADKLPGAPIPMLQFENRPEMEVIDSLLRSAAGYILSPRTVRTSGPSLYEMVMVLPTSSPVASGALPAVPGPFRTPGSPADEIPPVTPVTGVPAPATPPAQAPANTPAARPPAQPGVYVPIVPVTPVPVGGRGRGGGER